MPGVAIAVGYVLVLTSIAMLVLYVDHIGTIAAGVGVDRAGRQRHPTTSRRAVSGLVLVPDEPDRQRRSARRSRGCSSKIDRHRLVELAADADCVLDVVPASATFVPSGAPLMRIDGDTAAPRSRCRRSPP